MTRSELRAALAAEHPDLRRNEVELIVAVFFGEIAAQLAAGGRVELRGFGAFTVRSRKARVSYSPVTNRRSETPSTRAVRFRASKDLLSRLNP